MLLNNWLTFFQQAICPDVLSSAVSLCFSQRGISWSPNRRFFCKFLFLSNLNTCRVSVVGFFMRRQTHTFELISRYFILHQPLQKYCEATTNVALVFRSPMCPWVTSSSSQTRPAPSITSRSFRWGRLVVLSAAGWPAQCQILLHYLSWAF